MQSLTLPSQSPPATIIRCRGTTVYVNGRRRRDLNVVTWEVSGAPTFGRARLAMRMGGAVSPPSRVEDVFALPAVGAKVVLRASGLRSSDFCGVVTEHILQMGPTGESLQAEVVHQLTRDLSSTISRRWQLNAVGAGQPMDVTTVVFNADTNTLASASAVTVGSRTAKVFDGSSAAGRWSVADALGYLLATAVPEDVEVPGQEELDQLAGSIDLDELDVTGMTTGEAMMKVAQRGGLAVRSAREGLGLVFYQPGRGGRRRNIRLQRGGSSLALHKSNLWRGQITFHKRPSRRGVIALGEHKHYESTFQLQPGWDTTRETSRWRDIVRSQSPDWVSVANVYRKWVLNEHGWYCDGPWNLQAHDFSDISETDFPLRVARTFLPCLSRDIAGGSMGFVLEVSCDDGASWQRWMGPVWVSNFECAIYLGGDALPGEFFQASVAGQATARITATVAADVRLSAQITPDQAWGRKIVDYSQQAAWRSVHTGSVLYGNNELGQPAERDDSQLLEDLARRHATVVSAGTDARVELGWVDTSYHVGDVVERIEGREIELSSNPDNMPFVQSVRHDLGPGQRTELIISG